jgi:pentapeptide MXKDX repeat protein
LLSYFFLPSRLDSLYNERKALKQDIRFGFKNGNPAARRTFYQEQPMKKIVTLSILSLLMCSGAAIAANVPDAMAPSDAVKSDAMAKSDAVKSDAMSKGSDAMAKAGAVKHDAMGKAETVKTSATGKADAMKHDAMGKASDAMAPADAMKNDAMAPTPSSAPASTK